MRKVIFIKNVIIWLVIFVCGCIVMGVFIQNLVADLSSGVEIFIPGVSVLMIVVLAASVFAATRVVKYIKLLASK